MKTEEKQEKKRKHIALWIVLGVIVLIAVLGFWQRDNIMAAVAGIKYSSDELEQQMEENRQEMYEAVENNEDITVRDLTEEEKAGLSNGTVTREEIIEKLIEPDKSEEKPDSETTETDTAYEQYQHDLSALIAEVYVLQAEYTSQLDGMVEQARGEYAEKSEEEKSKTQLVAWASGYISTATEMERECDGKIDDIAVRMLKLIKEYGGDTSIVDEVVSAYAGEKSLKKSWYLSELKNRGLL